MTGLWDRDLDTDLAHLRAALLSGCHAGLSWPKRGKLKLEI
jgi:hypothetical protein